MIQLLTEVIRVGEHPLRVRNSCNRRNRSSRGMESVKESVLLLYRYFFKRRIEKQQEVICVEVNHRMYEMVWAG